MSFFLFRTLAPRMGEISCTVPSNSAQEDISAMNESSAPSIKAYPVKTAVPTPTHWPHTPQMPLAVTNARIPRLTSPRVRPLVFGYRLSNSTVSGWQRGCVFALIARDDQ